MWLIKQLSTGLYLADSGQWVEKASDAKTFHSESCTLAKQHQHNSRGNAVAAVYLESEE